MYQWIFFTILGQLVPILYFYMNLIIQNMVLFGFTGASIFIFKMFMPPQ
jgi:hypothetical protein